MSARLSLATVLAAVTLTGCVSYYTDAPAFQELEPPPQHGVIYVMRPTSQLGMLQDITARLDDERWFQLYPGSYGAFYVKPGKTKLRLGIDVWASAGIFGGGALTMAVSGAEADAKTAEIEIDVPPGGAVYVETAFGGWKEPPDAAVIPASDAKPDIEDLHLAAGGRPRLSRGATGAESSPPHAERIPAARDALAELARAVEEVARACKPSREIEGTCDATTEDANRAIATARAETDRVRSAELPLEAAKAFLAFSSMLEAVEADRSEKRPVTLSKLGALSKAMKDLESAADQAGQ